MALFRRGRIWWYELEVLGRRYRESTHTSSERLAGQIERKRHREVEAANGGIELKATRPILFPVAAADWLELKKPAWAPKTYVISKTDVEHLKTHFGKL